MSDQQYNAENLADFLGLQRVDNKIETFVSNVSCNPSFTVDKEDGADDGLLCSRETIFTPPSIVCTSNRWNRRKPTMPLTNAIMKTVDLFTVPSALPGWSIHPWSRNATERDLRTIPTWVAAMKE